MFGFVALGVSFGCECVFLFVNFQQKLGRLSNISMVNWQSEEVNVVLAVEFSVLKSTPIPSSALITILPGPTKRPLLTP